MTRPGPVSSLALGVLLLAGCLGGAGSPKVLRPLGHVYVHDGYTWPDPVAADDSGRPLPVPGWAALDAQDRSPPWALSFVPRLDTHVWGIPPDFLGPLTADVAVSPQGNIFVNVFDRTLRSADLGRTWKTVYEVSGPDPQKDDAFESAGSSLAYDAKNHRLYVHHLLAGDTRKQVDPLRCSALAYSDDEGQTWTEPGRTNWPASCVEETGSFLGRLVAASPGPRAPASLPTLAPPSSILYLCGYLPHGPTRSGFGACDVSDDGGQSFRPNPVSLVERHANSFTDGSILDPKPLPCLGAKPAAYLDGTLAMPIACGGPLRVNITEDEGRSWTTRHNDVYTFSRPFPASAALAVNPSGVAYLAFEPAGGNQTKVFRSRDKFATWEGPFLASPPELTNTRLAAIVVGDDDRIALAYAGTRTRANVLDPRYLHPQATIRIDWHLFVTQSFDATAEHPTFVSHQVTPNEAPLSVGYYCDGYLCLFGMYWDMALAPDGRVLLGVIADCTPRSDCPGNLDAVEHLAKDQQQALVVQTRGPSLLAAKGEVPPAGLDPHPTPPRGA